MQNTRVQSSSGALQPVTNGRQITLLILVVLAVAITVILHTSATYPVAFIGQMSAQADVLVSSTNQQTLAGVSHPGGAQGSISAHLVRISQLDPAQYTSQAQWQSWAESACSAAAMTEVLNAWWGFTRYRISDVLAQEVAAQAITPQLGLLDAQGIVRTMRRFGFLVDTGSGWSLDQLISMAQHTPVIVGFPPARYPGGHLLILRGGNGSSVQLVDSSLHHWQTISRHQFLAWWGGQAWIARWSPYAILGKPTLGAVRINQILAAYHSPMSGQGQAIATITARFGIDPTLALGFYLHESNMGTSGEARVTHSWGNLRCIQGAACLNTQGTGCQAGQSCYAAFASGVVGLLAWCQLMVSDLYVGDGRVIVDDIIGRYAPASDNNNVGGYIWSLKHSTDAWRAGAILIH